MPTTGAKQNADRPGSVPIVNPNVGEPKPDPDVIRHTHEHTHPEYPGAHINFPTDSHFHTHIPTCQHHTTDQRPEQHNDFTTRWERAEYERRRGAVRAWAGSDGNYRVYQLAGRDAGSEDQARRDTAVRQPDRQPDARTPAVSSGGAVSEHTDFNAARYGYVASGGHFPISNTDPLDRRRSGTHTHPDLHGDGGTLTHPNHDRNDPRHSHAGYGPRIDPGAGALHSATPAGYHLSSRAREHSNRGADAKHATPTIRAIDDTPDTDTSQDRRRRETLERYPRKDGYQEGSEAS